MAVTTRRRPSTRNGRTGATPIEAIRWTSSDDERAAEARAIARDLGDRPHIAWPRSRRDEAAAEDSADAEDTTGIQPDELEDAVDVAQHGREIAAAGVPYLVDGVIPAYGMLGFLVAYAKVGKTTFGQALAAHVAMGHPFLERTTTQTRVLVFAAEDPPEYTAWMARHLTVERGRMLFRRRPLRLGARDLEHITATIERERIGFVLIASWQAVVRGLIRDENDNAGAVCVVEQVKTAARASGIPWLIDAHAGKGEDQNDDADPSKAMRGASSAAGAADYTLSLRYANGTFGTQRRLSGKGRFVSLAPLSLDFDATTSTYQVIGTVRDVARETTWRLIEETGALSNEPRSLADIARCIGIVDDGERLTGHHRRQLLAALRRPDVGHVDDVYRGRKRTLFRRLDGCDSPFSIQGA